MRRLCERLQSTAADGSDAGLRRVDLTRLPAEPVSIHTALHDKFRNGIAVDNGLLPLSELFVRPDDPLGWRWFAASFDLSDLWPLLANQMATSVD
jgi:hypothetical protein